MYIFFLTYSLCSKGICQVLQLRLSKARIYSIVSQRYNRLHNHCTQVIRKKKRLMFCFCIFAFFENTIRKYEHKTSQM